MRQNYPISSVFNCGEAQVYAMQARVAITDRLAFIATKDGYVKHNPNFSTLDDESGFFDITAGLKYQLIDKPEIQFALAPALRVELPVGNDDVYSGHHKGLIIPSISLAKSFDKLHVLAGAGGEFSLDSDKGAGVLFYNLQVDYQVAKYFSPFIGINGVRYISNGASSLPIKLKGGTTIEQQDLGMPGFDGAEVLNLGTLS